MKNTKRVTGRRTLRFETLDAALADAEAVTAAPHRMLGNWTAAENLDHLAAGIEQCLRTDAPTYKVPLPMKLLGPLMLRRMVTKGFPAGIKTAPDVAKLFDPRPGVSLDDALSRYRNAVEAFAQGQPMPRNPMFGAMDKPTWEQFQCRHAELHQSFIVLGDSGQS